MDRDSELVSSIFDEREPAVMMMLELAISGSKRAGVPVGICGQAPSDYPEICEFIVEKGIDSISLSADSVLEAMEVIKEAEEKSDLEKQDRRFFH